MCEVYNIHLLSDDAEAPLNMVTRLILKTRLGNHLLFKCKYIKNNKKTSVEQLIFVLRYSNPWLWKMQRTLI